MSRTIRRSQLHLIRWWMPNIGPSVPSKDPWQRSRRPGLLYNKDEPVVVRRLQSDIHRFFAGPGLYYKKKNAKKIRSCMKEQIRKSVRAAEYDDFLTGRLIRSFEKYQ